MEGINLQCVHPCEFIKSVKGHFDFPMSILEKGRTSNLPNSYYIAVKSKKAPNLQQRPLQTYLGL
ncbi:hypothetical protein J6590_033130 [Homalodisca vitripennis]|nr:hypothetical protein J6590_033130 [Homalodisca vitripennis]